MASFDADLEDIIRRNQEKKTTYTRPGPFKPRRVQQRPAAAAATAKKPSARAVPPPKVTPPTKLNIRNLHYGVSDADIRELFSIGFQSYKSSAVYFGRNGRSKGAAHVLYGKKADALKAIKQFGGKKLDGRILKISIAPVFSSPAKKFVVRSEKRPARSSRAKVVVPSCTKEQLDRELDAYQAARK